MQVACAWCRTVTTVSSDMPGMISHAVCPDCAMELEYSRVPIDEFLERLPDAIMAMDAEGRVVVANGAACATLGKCPEEINGRLNGEVICCIYADLPGGCGRTIHCSGCTIRQSLDRTRSTGLAWEETPAYAFVNGPEGPGRLDLRISTERIGPLVLLRIDSLAFADEPIPEPRGEPC